MIVRDGRERERVERKKENLREREIVGNRIGSVRGRGRDIGGMRVCMIDVESRVWERRKVGG